MWTNILIGVLLTINLVACVLLVLIVLMQRSKQDGLGASFGSGLTDSMFGAQTSNVLVKGTSFLTATFFILSMVLAWLYGHQQKGSLMKAQAKVELSAPAAPIAPVVESSTIPTPAAAAALEPTTPVAAPIATAPEPTAKPAPVAPAAAKKDKK